MNEPIEKQIESWTSIQSLSRDILDMLTDEQLGLTVGKNMGTLGEQFRHMARVRFQYAEAIESKKLGYVIEKIDPAVAKSKARLVELWERANQKLKGVLENANPEELESKMIDWKYWGSDAVNIHDHLNFLMDHETMHNGEIIVYLRTHNLKFPQSWKAWGL